MKISDIFIIVRKQPDQPTRSHDLEFFLLCCAGTLCFGGFALFCLTHAMFPGAVKFGFPALMCLYSAYAERPRKR